MSELRPVYIATSMIQRDAIISHLEGLGIEGLSSERDVSRRYSDTTIDLAFEGYSATMGGFPIYVLPENTETAKAEIKKFLARVEAQIIEPTSTTQNLDRYYVAAMFSFALPILIPFAIHRLILGLQNKEKMRPVAFVVSSIFVLIGLGLWGNVAYTFVSDWIMQGHLPSALFRRH